MADKRQLIQDLYSKYSPDTELTEDRIKAIEAKYGDNTESFIKDFYAKYAPAENVPKERIDAIHQKYGLKKKEPTQPSSSVTPSQSPGKSNFETTFEKGLPKPEKGVVGVEDTTVTTTTTEQEATPQEQPSNKPTSFVEMITASANDAFGRKINQSDNTNVVQQVKGIKNPNTGKVEVVDQTQQIKVEQQPAVQKFAGKGEVNPDANWEEVPDLIKQEGYKQFVAPIFKTLGIIQSDIQNKIAYSIPGMMMEIAPAKVDDFAAYQFGKAIDAYTELTYPVSEQTKQSTAGQLVSGVASLGGYVALGSASTAMGIGPIVMPAVFGAMQNGAQEYERAYESVQDAQNLSDQDWYAKYAAGKDYEQAIAQKQELANKNPDQTAFDTWIGASLVGSAEGLPIMS